MMKKIVLRTFYFAAFSIVLASCKKTDRLEKPIAQETVKSDFEFLNKNLRQFAKMMAPAIQSPTGREKIREMAKRKFDEEYEVLVKDLVADPTISPLVSIVESQNLHEDLRRRSQLHLYPQVYIPRF